MVRTLDDSRSSRAAAVRATFNSAAASIKQITNSTQFIKLIKLRRQRCLARHLRTYALQWQLCWSSVSRRYSSFSFSLIKSWKQCFIATTQLLPREQRLQVFWWQHFASFTGLWVDFALETVLRQSIKCRVQEKWLFLWGSLTAFLSSEKRCLIFFLILYGLTILSFNAVGASTGVCRPFKIRKWTFVLFLYVALLTMMTGR